MTPLFHDPMQVFAFCCLVCGGVFWAAGQRWSRRFFRIVPTLALIYYVPTFASTFGVIPSDSAVYDWMRDYLLPFSLFVLMATADIPAVLKVGPRALFMMLAGTLGVVIGGPVALSLFKSWLPPESWKGLAALSGSWIGGGGNFAAIKESVGAPDSIIGPIIIVDTAIAYTWMGLLLFLSNFQAGLDRLLRADSRILEDLNHRLRHYREERSRPLRLADVSVVLAVGFGGGVGCLALAGYLHERTGPVLSAWAPSLSSVFSSFTWLVILISTLGILLSFTPIRNLEAGGASKLGYAALYLFLTSIGAKADLGGILAAPVLLLVGVVWMLVHVGTLLIVARLIRAPWFLLAVGSQANIGGAASAPLVAAAYYESMAPVGVLMGVLGYLLGTYAGLFCAYLLSLLAN